VKYPVFLGFRLEQEELLLAEYILHSLKSRGLKSIQDPFFSDLSSGIAFYPAADENTVKTISDWMHPVLIFTGKKTEKNKKDHDAFFYENGIAAVWKIPENGLILPPRLELPELKKIAYFISENSLYRKLFRQILSFGGYSVRTDFQSNETLNTELKRIAETDPKIWPALILVDLDSERIDISSFFYFLRSLFQKNPSLKSKTSVMAIKDFALPGLDLGTISTSLKPLTKRIFHPHEAILALCEAVSAPPISEKKDDIRIKPFRNLEEILYGTAGNYSDPASLKFMDQYIQTGQIFSRFILFSWLAEYLLSEEVASGVLLSPEPVIDPRNFLNSIRRP